MAMYPALTVTLADTATDAAATAPGHVHVHVHWLWTVVFILAVITVIVCIPLQRRALNKIAFGRSMFISWTAIIMGLIIALLPSIPAAIVAICLFLLGFGFMILMAVKSYQHMQLVKQQRGGQTVSK